MKCRFWLLDLNEGVWEGKPCVRLWAIDEQNEPVVIIATQVAPYFYFLPDDDPDSTLKAILADKQRFPYIADISIEKRKLRGRERSVLRVSCSRASDVSTYAKQLPKLKSGSSFDDVRLSTHYVSDLMLITCGWNECEVESVQADGVISLQVYLATTAPRGFSFDRPPKLRLLAFAQVAVGLSGSAQPERDPIRALAIVTDAGKLTCLSSVGDDDSELVSSFTASVTEFDPDVIVGYGTNKSQWPYLTKRAKANKHRLAVGRDKSEPHTSLFGHVSITGRVNLDLSDLAAGVTEMKVKDLKHLARHFKLPVAEKLLGLDEWGTAALWADEARQQLFDEARLSAETCLELAQATINYPVQLSAITGMPLDQVMTAAVGFRVDSYLLRVASKIGELIPPKNEQPFLTYRGGLVQEPKTGLHTKVAVLDFASMYPSLMKKYNLSPDTLVAPTEEASPESVNLIPEVGHRFRKEPDGFYRIALAALIEERARIRRELVSVAGDQTITRVLEERERAVKVITNACYGYAGWAGARWYMREVAESAAALGRRLITETIEKAKALGLEVIYSDTDSIFISNVKPKVEELMTWVNKDPGLEIRIDLEYVRVLFTEAMKRYAGLRRDGTLDIVGLEVVRGDWSEIAREVQENVLRIILNLQPTAQANESVRETVQRMKNGEFPIEAFTIRKTLTKPIEEYRVRTPHAEVAKRLAKEGWEIDVGDKVGYVVVKGKGTLFQKARPYHEAKLEDLDLEYYVENQVKPSAMRILEAFGVTETQLGI